ncbi:MAG: hypothetical protein R3C49_16865 [Planctomycetaceae bacterium]
MFLKRNEGADRRRGREHLQKALELAERMKLPDARDLRILVRRL